MFDEGLQQNGPTCPKISARRKQILGSQDVLIKRPNALAKTAPTRYMTPSNPQLVWMCKDWWRSVHLRALAGLGFVGRHSEGCGANTGSMGVRALTSGLEFVEDVGVGQPETT